METRGDTGERRQRRRAGFIFGLAVTFLIGRLNNGRGFINTAAPEFIIQTVKRIRSKLTRLITTLCDSFS